MDQTQNQKIDQLSEDVTSLKYDNERLIKPALAEIREILSRDIYVTKSDYAELKKEVENLKTELEKERQKTANYKLVEKLVFSFVGLVLLTVVGALIGLVVTVSARH